MSSRPVLGRARRSERARGTAFELVLMACLGFGILVLGVLLYDVVTTGWSRFDLDLVRLARERGVALQLLRQEVALEGKRFLGAE